MKIPIILVLFLLIIIKNEKSYGEIKSSNINDSQNGYDHFRGKVLTHFYLCGDHHYRVHYLGDPRDQWTGEYCNCDPVGNGRPIDGIARWEWISSQIKNGDWLDMAYGYIFMFIKIKWWIFK